MGSEQPKGTEHGRVIVVCGAKGGVGKTVFAVNLAVGLAKERTERVGLVDLDVMAAGDMAHMRAL
jgi:pilus assembly protein CpaE